MDITAEKIVAAHDAHARAVANLRNAVAMPADDPRDAEKMREKAAEGYAAALAGLDEVRDAVRAAGPVRAPGAEEPFAGVKSAAENKTPPPTPVGSPTPEAA